MSALRCAYCHGSDALLEPCPGCGTRLHADCWRDAVRCPTLGCAPAPVRVAARPRTAGRAPWSMLRLAVWTWSVLVLGAVALVALPPWLGSPTIVVRNDTGTTLHDVELHVFNPDFRGVERSEELKPGAELRVSGGGTSYPLGLGGVEFTLRGERWSRGGAYFAEAYPWSESVYSLDAEGRLRTVLQSQGKGEPPVPCTCPEQNASGKGSRECAIRRHRR